MDKELKELVSDLVSLDPEDGTLSRKELADAYAASQEAVKAILDGANGDIEQLDAENAQSVNKLLDARDAFKAALDKIPDNKAVKARIAQGAAFLRTPTSRPASSAGTLSGTGTAHSAAEKTGAIELVESEEDKIIAQPPFKSIGHFYKAVHLDGMNKHEAWAAEGISKWQSAVKAAMSTWDDPSAGILVPEAYSNEIEKRMLVQENLMNQCRVTPITGSSMTFFRRQDASRVNGSRHAGVAVAYEGEADTLASTRARYEKYRIEAHKLACLVEVTEELLQDSPYGIASEISDLAAEAIMFTHSDKMVNGTGAGMPLGIMAGTPTSTTGCRVVVAKETGQAAASLDFRNITKMWMRLDPASRADAVWMINNDVSDELDNLAFPVGTGGVPAYLPAGGLSSTGYASLKGRPVIPFEYCATLGTEGDIILASWKNGYRAVSKGGINAALSTHIYFERDSNCYRFTNRFGGQPRWQVPFTPKNGSTTTACFVTLATRA